jgi:putative oxidoreductase
MWERDLMNIDIGLLLLRVLLGGLLFIHATQKLAGWFHGPGLQRSAAAFEAIGQRPGLMLSIVAGASELTAGLLLLFGFGVPLGAAIAAGTMLVAGTAVTTFSHSPWSDDGGGEFPWALGAAALGLGFTGPGEYSIDALVDAPWATLSGREATWLGLGVVGLAVVAATPPVLRTRRLLDQPLNDRDELPIGHWPGTFSADPLRPLN